MRFIRRFDDSMVVWVTRACHALQRATGISSFQIIKGCARAGIVVSGLLALSYWVPIPYAVAHDIQTPVVFIYSVVAVYWWRVSTALPSQADGEVLPEMLKILRAPLLLRVLLVLDLIYGLVRMWFDHPTLVDAHRVIFALVAYLYEVQPLPPCRGWLFEPIVSRTASSEI